MAQRQNSSPSRFLVPVRPTPAHYPNQETEDDSSDEFARVAHAVILSPSADSIVKFFPVNSSMPAVMAIATPARVCRKSSRKRRLADQADGVNLPSALAAVSQQTLPVCGRSLLRRMAWPHSSA